MTDKQYHKDKSISSLSITRPSGSVDCQTERARKSLVSSAPPAEYASILTELTQQISEEGSFRLSQYAAEEMARLQDDQLIRYLINRYRYDTFPKNKRLDAAPPCLQIEPTSVCNFRCPFCYQSDPSFTEKNAGHMGMMDTGLFREIIEEATGKVEFVTLASRGEPLLHPEIKELLQVCAGRFLGLKLNTNASRLDEAISHAILAADVRTLVFSIDTDNAEQYEHFRVGGCMEQTRHALETFQQVRRRHYPDSPLISRISGVYYDPRVQDEQVSLNAWAELADQVALVRYLPWERLYEGDPREETTPCSDLWRRMFIWHDGRVNPCDCDYCSLLSVGDFNGSLRDVWRSVQYEKLRTSHCAGQRPGLEPCCRCQFS